MNNRGNCKINKERSTKKLLGSAGLFSLLLGLGFIYSCANGGEGSSNGAAPRIYVADDGNSRITRMDDMTGANWTVFGTSGSGINQFNDPLGIFLR